MDDTRNRFSRSVLVWSILIVRGPLHNLGRRNQGRVGGEGQEHLHEPS